MDTFAAKDGDDISALGDGGLLDGGSYGSAGLPTDEDLFPALALELLALDVL